MSNRIENVGGHPIIDFVNTEIVEQGKRVNLLAQMDDYMSWLVATGLLNEREAEKAADRWGKTAVFPTVMPQLQAFRQQMRQMLAEQVGQSAPSAESLENINGWLKKWEGRPQLSIYDGNIVQTWQHTLEQPEAILAILANAASDLLTAHDLTYLRACGNPDCIRFFLDTSRNHSRRWCTMEGCGNRMKARAFYQRQKEGQ